MVRYNYFPQITTINDLFINDLASIDWNLFEFTRGYQIHKLDQNEINKFYLVVRKYYGTLFNEDIIFYINRILNPLELRVAQEIIIPHPQDIDDFLARFAPNRTI